MDSESLDELEGPALEASNRIISSIESLMATWEAAKDKPQEFAADVNRLRFMHQSLCEWERRILRIPKADLSGRKAILQRFSEILEPYK